MSRRGESKSLVADVYEKVRREIFQGKYLPGQRLQPTILGKTHAASNTVVREALTQLAGERLLDSQTGVGFYVPVFDKNSIADLTEVRCHIDSLGVKLAIERGGLAWESALIAAHHRLQRTPLRGEDGARNEEWFIAHSAFHAALIEACGVPVLIGMSRSLAASTELMRVWSGSVKQGVKRDIDGEHVAILDAVLQRDAEKAQALLCDHYRMTMDFLLSNWNVIPAPDKPQRRTRSKSHT